MSLRRNILGENVWQAESEASVLPLLGRACRQEADRGKLSLLTIKFCSWVLTLARLKLRHWRRPILSSDWRMLCPLPGFHSKVLGLMADSVRKIAYTSEWSLLITNEWRARTIGMQVKYSAKIWRLGCVLRRPGSLTKPSIHILAEYRSMYGFRHERCMQLFDRIHIFGITMVHVKACAEKGLFC